MIPFKTKRNFIHLLFGHHSHPHHQGSQMVDLSFSTSKPIMRRPLGSYMISLPTIMTHKSFLCTILFLLIGKRLMRCLRIWFFIKFSKILGGFEMVKVFRRIMVFITRRCLRIWAKLWNTCVASKHFHTFPHWPLYLFRFFLDLKANKL